MYIYVKKKIKIQVLQTSLGKKVQVLKSTSVKSIAAQESVITNSKDKGAIICYLCV